MKKKNNNIKQTTSEITYDLSEVNRRLEVAASYKEFISTYTSNNPSVTHELKQFAQSRLEELLGIRAPIDSNQHGFSEEKRIVLDKLADAALKKYAPQDSPQRYENSDNEQSSAVPMVAVVPKTTNNKKMLPGVQKTVAKESKNVKIGGQVISPDMIPMPSGPAAASIMTTLALENFPDSTSGIVGGIAADIIKKG